MSQYHVPRVKRHIARAIPAGHLDVGDVVMTSRGPIEVDLKVTHEIGDGKDQKRFSFHGDGWSLSAHGDEPVWVDDGEEPDVRVTSSEQGAEEMMLLARRLYYTLIDVTEAHESDEWAKSFPSETSASIRTAIRLVRESGILLPRP
jgi:hypothetical protein